ncbi:HNH endonuclease [Patescibacteria group bacterium]|nr:HNH endonuclease [Patescibacteria group bacterium]
MEKELGLDFIDDYNRNYLHGDLGQKRFAAKWGVSKNLIFANNLRGNRRSWFQMLNLPKKDSQLRSTVPGRDLPACECCGEEIPLDKAHWKEHEKGGPYKSYNLINLCPNCHRKLDRGDSEITHKCRKILLFREINNFNTKDYTEEKAETLLSICENIILERR